MGSNSPTDQQAPPQGVGLSHLRDAEAGREAVRAALAGHTPTADDVIILFTTVDRDVEALYRAAIAEAAPAGVFGCSSTGGFTDTDQVPSGCVAALLAADERSFGICHVERDEDDIAGSARRAAQGARDRAGDRHPHSVLLLLTDGMIRDQREVARGAYEVTTAVTPFVGGVAADALTWDCTYTFGDGRVLTNGIVAAWINSELPIGVSVGHGWRPAGRPMLVTRAEGTIVHELDGTPALEAYMAERGARIDPDDAEFFRKVMGNPVGLPNARGKYDVRQLHAYLPEGGGINFNAGISEQSILQVMSADTDALVDGARCAAEEAVRNLDQRASVVLVFSCGSRVPLLGERVRDEVIAVSSALDGVPVCGFYTYGEFARTTGSSGFHNSSVSVLAL